MEISPGLIDMGTQTTRDQKMMRGQVNTSRGYESILIFYVSNIMCLSDQMMRRTVNFFILAPHPLWFTSLVTRGYYVLTPDTCVKTRVTCQYIIVCEDTCQLLIVTSMSLASFVRIQRRVKSILGQRGVHICRILLTLSVQTRSISINWPLGSFLWVKDILQSFFTELSNLLLSEDAWMSGERGVSQ